MSFAFSVTEYKSEAKASSEATDPGERAVGRYHLAVSCVGKECRKVNDREEMDTNLQTWVSGVAAGL